MDALFSRGHMSNALALAKAAREETGTVHSFERVRLRTTKIQGEPFQWLRPRFLFRFIGEFLQNIYLELTSNQSFDR